MRNTILKWLLLTLLLAYAAYMTVWGSEHVAQQKCTGVEIDVQSTQPGLATIITRGLQTQLSSVEPYYGRPISDINLGKIQRWLQNLNNLENAYCAINAAGKLCISAEALVPEMRVFGPGGTSYYVNRQGKRMNTRAEFFTDVPIVSGQFGSQYTERALLPLTHRLASDSLLHNLFSMVDAYDPQNILLIPRIKGHVVNLGDTSRLAEKFKALLSFYRKVMPYKGWDKYERITLKYRGQIVATLRDKPVAPETTEEDNEEDIEEAALQQAGLPPEKQLVPQEQPKTATPSKPAETTP